MKTPLFIALLVLFSTNLVAQTNTVVDTDSDGFIEINDLEGLNAMRYQLDGTGYRASSDADLITTGCPTDGCFGYELTRSLDFNDDDSYRSPVNRTAWTTGAGWQPIGNVYTPFNALLFASTNNLVIRNLYINRPDEDYAGLFGVINSTIFNIHLRDVNINARFVAGGLVASTFGGGLIAGSSSAGTVSGSDAWIGGLVGLHYGSIIASYAEGEVIGDTSVGGLAGFALGPITNSYAHSNVKAQAYSGGLVGYHLGQSGITNSYAIGSVESVFYAGGLVGYNDAAIITNAYALGDVVGGTAVGGLVGYNDVGTIANTYALGTITGANNVGGLVGDGSGGSTTRSYTATQLEANLARSDWSADNWEADGVSPPKLKYGGRFPGDFAEQRIDSYRYTTCGAENIPSCGVVIPDQDASEGKLLALSELTLSVGTLEPPFNPSISEYEILDISGDQMQTTVTATANKTDASVSIGLRSQAAVPMSHEATLTAQLADLMNDSIVITVTASGQTTQEYTITLPAQPDLTGNPTAPCNSANIDADGDGLIDICDIEGLYAIRYQLSGLLATCGENGNEACRGYELLRDLDFDADASYRNPQPTSRYGVKAEAGIR